MFLARTSLIILLPCTVLVLLSVLIGQVQYPSVISFASSSGGGDYHLQLLDIFQNRTYQLNDNNVFCCPVWSPDGQKVIFILSYQQGSNLRKRLYLMNANGSHARPLTAASAPDPLFADWSPDGEHIVYVTMPLGQDTEIAVMDWQTGVTQQLTSNAQDDDSPQWSPDGRFIVYRSRSESGTWDIYRMNPHGEDVQPLTDSQGNDLYPRISPDSRRIAFVSDRTANRDLFVMSADGTDLRQLTSTPALEMIPLWSPDGSQILFQSQRQGAVYGGINVIDADGRNLLQLIDSTVPTHPADTFWSPDGSHIVFVSESETGSPNIFVMDADGSHVRQITNNLHPVTYPAWQPRPYRAGN
ncbi:MAG: PD40 domain-containing protein [Anaerolineae bacterium]|nr:PD40 domain-containing protein [Anaerolineae bacterium]